MSVDVHKEAVPKWAWRRRRWARRQAKWVMRGTHLACWHGFHLLSCNPFGFGELELLFGGVVTIRGAERGEGWLWEFLG